MRLQNMKATALILAALVMVAVVAANPAPEQEQEPYRYAGRQPNNPGYFGSNRLANDVPQPGWRLREFSPRQSQQKIAQPGDGCYRDSHANLICAY